MKGVAGGGGSSACLINGGTHGGEMSHFAEGTRLGFAVNVEGGAKRLERLVQTFIAHRSAKTFGADNVGHNGRLT